MGVTHRNPPETLRGFLSESVPVIRRIVWRSLARFADRRADAALATEIWNQTGGRP